MKKIILGMLLISTTSFAQILGEDALGGKMTLEVSGGPIIFNTKIMAQRSLNPASSDPYLILSAFDVCKVRDLVPRFVDLDHGKADGLFYYGHSFKCVGGDTEDWIRLVKWQCWDLKPDEDAARINLCSMIGSKWGDSVVKCSGRCETVQDKTLGFYN